MKLLLKHMFMLKLLMIADGLSVKGPSAPLVVPVGGSVVLNCSSDELLPVEGLEVEWRRRDSETLVHLFSEGKSREEVQQQEHQGRAHFFTDQIPQGNFSLLLERVRAEDQGEYTCKVYSGEDSAETVVEIRDVERLLVSGSDVSVSAYVGEDVTLNCSVDSHEDIDEVSWKKRETDGDVLVLLYQDNESLPEVAHERYRDRVQFFSAETSRGNFSVRLKSVRTEDKGVYMCQVFAGDLQANATVTINRLGSSGLHKLLMFFCGAAGVSSVLLFSLIVYNRSRSKNVWNLHLALILCPNVCLSFAFVIWGLTEGSLEETITCYSLYFLRPLFLIWTLRYLKNFQERAERWKRFSGLTMVTAVFTLIVCSVFFTRVLEKSTHVSTGVKLLYNRLATAVLVLMVLVCLLETGGECWRLMSAIRQTDPEDSKRCVVLRGLSWALGQALLYCSCSFQFLLMVGLNNVLSVVLSGVELLLSFLLACFLRLQCKFLQKERNKLVCIIILTLMFFFLIGFLIGFSEKNEDFLNWTLVLVFTKVLNISGMLQHSYKDFKRRHHPNQPQAKTFPVPCFATSRFSGSDFQRHECVHEVVFMFGAVFVVLLNSVTLLTELILTSQTAARVVKDLRLVVFPSESVFVFYYLILLVYATVWKPKSSQRRHPSDTPVEMEEMNASGPDGVMMIKNTQDSI